MPLSLNRLASLGGTSNPWNGPHAIENAGQASSYSRAQLTGVIAEAASINSRFLRFPIEFSYHFRSPDTIYTGNLLDWFFYTCFQYGVIPFPVLHGHPNNAQQAGWTATYPADGRFIHGNKPEPEQITDTKERWTAALDILAYEANRAGCPQSIIPVQNGNELGKGGSGDWRPYEEQLPANPEELSADGTVPQSVVSFRGDLLANVIRNYDFIAVSPAIEAETTTIMQAEIDSVGWKTVLNLHDKIAIHAYSETSGVMNRCYASYAQGVSYKARKTILTNNSITLPVWVTECGRLQTEVAPTGAYIADVMATTCKKLGAEEAFGFVLVMNDNDYAAYVKTDFSVSAPAWPGSEGS